MKRRVLSLMIALALCLNLLPLQTSAVDLTGELPADGSGQVQDQLDGMGAVVQSDSAGVSGNITFDSDRKDANPFVVSGPMLVDTNGFTFTFTGTGSSAIQVTGTGDLTFKGHVIAQSSVAVEVESGGSLSITDSSTVISGSSYGLKLASGANVSLSVGMYTGGIAAIWTENGDFSALLAPGYAFFDTNGNPVSPDNMATVRAVTVGQCTEHSKTYVHASGATEHTWTCEYCGATGTEKCTFDFDYVGYGTSDCGNSLTIAVDERTLPGLVYDGTDKEASVGITVTLTDPSGAEYTLVKDTDYKVEHVSRTDVGEITVTVTGLTFNGTFTKTYNVEQDEPGISWDAITYSVDYDSRGLPVDSTKLPPITITINANGEDLHPFLKYSYREKGNTEFIDGLPTNAGTYEVKAYIPESQNYKAAETQQLLELTINKIRALITAPVAALPTYNGSSQALVTAGEVENGAVIEYAEKETGPYTTVIPTGINAGDYTVWYRIVGTDNYIGTPATEVLGVKIERKTITPIVTLSDYTYLYDGGEKEPKVTVKDEDDVTVLLDTEYEVEYVNNRNVSTDGAPAKVVVSDKAGGNYAIDRVEVEFKITFREQATLSITEKPDTVTYGDEFTLSTLGGSGNGNITWEVVDDLANDGSATVNRTSGLVRITGAGTITVKATKSGMDPETNIQNYDDATATWTFEADKKAVVATVTADDKDYNGDADATIHAEVKSGVLPGDKIEITGLTGEFDDENAGANKTVTVNKDDAKIDGVNYEHYDISYSSLTVTATIRKAIVHITQAPAPATLTYNGNPQALIGTGAVVDTTGVAVEYALSEDGPYSTDFPKATNAGAYTVWYRVQETPNYTGLDPASVDVEIVKKPVTPEITLSGSGLQTDDNSASPSPMQFCIYDGTAKEPDVTLKDKNGNMIPADEYTVAYSSNTNVGIATVTVTAKAGGNYDFTPNPVTKNFKIEKKQAEVTTAPKPAGTPLTYSTWAQELVTEGEGYGGTMVYALEAADGTKTYSETIPTEINAGEYTVYYKVKGDDNHSDSDVGQVDVTIAPKTVKDPTIDLFDENGDPLVSYTYNGQAKKPTVVVKVGSTVIGTTDSTTGENDEYNVVYTDNIDAGKATVSITDKLGGNYTITGSKEFVIVKADIVFSPSPSAANITYDGKAHELLVPGTTSGGEVLYALNSATSTYNAAIPTATEAGNYTVYYKVIGDKNHNDLNDIENQKVDVTIKRKPLTDITIKLTPEGFEYDGKEKLPEVTVMDGRTVLPEEEYTWTCNVDSPTAAGTYTITISDASGGNYDLDSVTNKTATFTIGQIPQEELVIGGKPSVTNYGDSFQLTVSGGSGNGAETWNATGPASVDTSGNVTITGVGEVTITVKKDTDTNYLAAQTQWTFTAAPKPVTASVVVADRDYDGTTDATVFSADIAADLLIGDVVTIEKTSITAAFDTPSVGTGKTVTLDTSKVKVTGDDADKYAISYPATVTADITKATNSITTDPVGINSLIYNGQPQALVTAGESNVGFIVYSLEENGTYSPEIPTGTDAGTYTVYYKVDETANYAGIAVNTTAISVTIDRKTVTATVELSESSYVYDGAKHEPKITVKDGRTVIDEDQYTVVWKDDNSPAATDVLTNASTYTATITGKSDGNYNFTATAQVTITAAPQDALHITGQPEHVYYGDTVTMLGTTGGSGNGTVKWTLSGETYSTIDPATGKLIVKDTGTITVTAERVVLNYGTVSDTWTFTVEPKPVVAEVTVTAKAYDGTTDVDDDDITATVKASDLVDPDNDSITISGLTGTYDNANAGTNKTVTLSDNGVIITGDTGKYTVSYPATVKADITPREVTVEVELSGNDLQTDNTTTPTTYSYEYDGTEKTPSVTVKGTDAGGYNATLAASDYTVSYAGNKNVGTATVTVTSSEGGNYTFTEAEVHFAIEKAAAQLTSSPQAKDLTYTGQAQELVTVGTASGGHIEYTLDNADPSTYSTDIPTETKADTYIVYYKVVGDDNHEGSTASGQVSVTIKPKEITPTITLDQDTFTYNGYEHKPNVTVEDDGTTIGTGEYSVTYRDNINAGTATVIVSDANGGNYIVNGTATFTIEKAAPVVTDPEANTGLQYNGSPQELVKAGVSSDGTVVYSVNGGNYSAAIPTASAVDTYTITYKVLGDANHSDTPPGTLTVDIDKNTVTSPTISLSADTFKYNGSQQKPTIIVYDANSRVIPEYEYTVAITGGDMVDVGTYTVTVTTPANSNYVIQGNNTRTFDIVRADQETISITGTQAQVRYGDVIQLGTTGGTGSGSITWTVTGADGNPVDSTISTTGLLTVKDVGGPITVTATRSAGGNYSDVSATWEFSAGKKQVTAVVTAADRPYATGNKSATVTATVPNSELVSGDSITITGLTGEFDDDSVGTNKKVTLKASSAAVTGTNEDRYDITYPATATASILAVAATVDTEPGTVTPTLTYDASQAQELVTAGAVTGGTMVYSLDGTNFTPVIPKAKDAGSYTVYFKAQGDGNHTDSEVDSVQVTIVKQTVATPQIELSPPSAKYDGNVKRPEVTVLDSANNVIPASEYKVTYVTDGGENWTDQGTYTVKIENISGGNYVVNTDTKNFIISTTAQSPLEIVNKPGLVYYGDTFTLSATGGSGSGAVTWESSDEDIAYVDENGFVTIKGVGSATITATRSGGANYDDATATYSFNALKKPITAIVTAEDRVYASGVTNATIHITWKDGDLVSGDSIDILSMSGTFDSEYVGTNKTVTISVLLNNDSTAQKYDITIPGTTTASILKADAAARTLSANDRTYDGTSQPLVTGGNAGTTFYSDARDGVYSTTVPTGTNAGTYTVWYKEKGDSNHNDSEPQAVTVTISRKTLTVSDTNATLSGSDLQTDADDGTYYYEYDGTEKTPSVIIADGAATVPASEYTVSYSGNKNVGDATVTITNAEGGNYDVSGSVDFKIREGAAQLTSSPQAKDLTYTGEEQELVTVGTASGGHIEYTQDKDDEDSYSEDIPTGTGAGTYTVYYKVVGDSNHADSTTVGSVTVTIKPKEIVSPKITVSGSYTYDGTAQEPGKAKVKVEDGDETIADTEYDVTYRDNVNAGTATVIITNANGGNYIVNGTGTFTIAKANVTDITAPEGLENLPYNGAAQALVKAGSASGGTMVYSLDEDGEYSPAIPTATAVGSYEIWYKVQGDDNHNDSDPASVDASIIKNTVASPTVQVMPETVTYNGKKQEPTVTVMDGGNVIDGSEYTVTYADKNGNDDLTSEGEYTLTISSTGTNYLFTATATFTILPADQTPLTITGTRERVYYGDTIQLGTTGGNGTVSWAVEDDGSTIATINNGRLEITGVGSVKVTATSKADGYADQTATWSFYAEEKPVTAVVTAAARPYSAGDTSATVTATLQSSDLVNGDDITITLSGSFEDPDAGTDKKVNIDSSNPTVTGTNSDKYAITYPATTTASILKADIDTTDATKVTAPTAAENLVYTGNPQYLVTAGSSTEGTMEYSLDKLAYSASLPTGTNAGDYEIWYRVKGDSNHNDTDGIPLGGKVTIAKQEVKTPTIEFTPNSVSYDGAVHKPSVTVKDNNGRVIPDSEYTVTYDPDADWKTAGDHTVTITGKTDGNYDITTKTADFTILPMGQNPLSIVNQPGMVQYGDTFTLSTVGGSGTGTVTWNSSNTTVATIDAQSGLVKVLKSGGPVEITATKAADGNYGAVTVTWTFSAEKRSATAVVTAKDREYDGNTNADLVITWQAGDLLKGDTIDLDSVLTGTFNDANAGTNKIVRITGTLSDSDKYDVSWNTTTTASITPKTASVSGVTAQTDLKYNRNAQPLVNEGTVTGGGTLVYSLDGVSYTPNVPTGTAAGTYNVWYKAEADASGNYKDSTPARVVVTIEPKQVDDPVITLSPATFDYDGSAKKPDVEVKDGNIVIPASEYTVSYSNNTAVGEATVTVSNADGGNYDITTKTAKFNIKAGAAVLTGAPQAKSLTYNGNPQELVTDGTAVNGHVVYSLTGNADDFTSDIPKGTNADTYPVYYKVEGENGASDTAARVVYVTIQPKSVHPTVTVLDNPVTYDGKAQKPPLLVSAENRRLQEGTDYSVFYSSNINPGTATVMVWSVDGSNYQFSTSTTFEIVKEAAKFTENPTGKTGLTYNGKAQKLVEAGEVEGGIAYYSLNGAAYSPAIPTGVDVDEYIILAKVVGDSTHADSDPISITAKIAVNTPDDPRIELDGSSFSYTGNEIKPSVTVYDDDENVIPATEYTVSYANNVNVSTDASKATVTVTSKGSNYSFTANTTFEIIGADQIPLAITGKQDAVYYGDTLTLGVTGGSVSGAVTWKSSDETIATVSSGVVSIKKAGTVTITATQAASDGYKAVSDTWTFYAQPKPVTPIVTAASRPYDGTMDVVLTVTVSSGLIGTDSIPSGSVTATGHFTDENVGTGKTVVIDTWTVPSAISEKYDIINPGTTTASITQKAASVTDAPKGVEDLKYTGDPQALVSGGTVEGGNLAYSLDGVNYSFNVPTGTDAKTYTVWYKVIANDDNYKDSAMAKVDVAIAPNTDEPNVLCTPNTIQYDGTAKTPTVVVLDSENRTIPESEYTVKFKEDDRIAVGEYTVTVTDKPGGNYDFTNVSAPVTGTFKIVEASQNPLSIVTDIPTEVYYGDTFRLSAMGGSGSGAIVWNIEESTVAVIDSDGVVTVTGTGAFTVEAYRAAADGYSQSNTVSVPFHANPKPVTPVVTADDKSYDGTTNATLHAAFKTGDLVGNDSITLNVGTGQFASEDVGTNKRVTITQGTPSGEYGNYFITWPESTTASINKVDAKIATKPMATNPTYDGNSKALVNPGITKDGIGTIEYSMSQNGEYSEDIPTATNADTYTVWYRVADSVNYTGVTAASIEVVIGKATPIITTLPKASPITYGQTLSESKLNGGSEGVPGTYAWEDGSIVPDVGQIEYNVIFTPEDTANYNPVTIQVEVTVTNSSATSNTIPNPPNTNSNTNNTGSTNATAANVSSASVQTTVRNGTASTVVSEAAGRELVQAAAASQSGSIVIEPEITGAVTRTEVSIPASTLSRISSETDAALVVSSPVADVTISNAALDTLSLAGGDVSVAAEQVEQAVVLTLTAGGETVESVPGGVTLTVPVEDAVPGTVAVLVHDDGTRETLRKSIVEDGQLSIPLDGSATVEIVDNSKDFADVPDASWAAEAVAFASAHELFSGTSETTFSPDLAMSRAMLATVLYSLEGSPEQELTSAFSDVASGAWYAEGVAWAVENGIVSGYGDGQFGPNDSITREQFAVMLWRYAGSPEASSQTLDFADADQVSGYALEALCWAVENGILNGYGDGQLAPEGTATRAQAAQMLKNFMENTR